MSWFPDSGPHKVERVREGVSREGPRMREVRPVAALDHHTSVMPYGQKDRNREAPCKGEPQGDRFEAGDDGVEQDHRSA